MNRLFLVVGVLAIGACGSEDDDRPATLPYITEAILKPACGGPECHSSFANTDGYSLDTVKAARASFINGGFVIDDGQDASTASLAIILVKPFPIGNPPDYEQMPYDQPLPTYDIDLIKKWIATQDENEGNSAFGPDGAQCIPSDADATVGCNYQGQVVACDADGNSDGTVIKTCAAGETCVEGACAASN